MIPYHTILLSWQDWVPKACVDKSESSCKLLKYHIDTIAAYDLHLCSSIMQSLLLLPRLHFAQLRLRLIFKPVSRYLHSLQLTCRTSQILLTKTICSPSEEIVALY
jgi:hypothetical protein